MNRKNNCWGLIGEQNNPEQSVKESENVNQYMPEADFHEKTFDMIAPNVRQARMKEGSFMLHFWKNWKSYNFFHG